MSECLNVWMSGCLNVWMPECLNVWMSGCLNVWTSECLNIWLSECLTVWLLVFFDIQTFRQSGIQTFRHPDIQTFRHPDIDAPDVQKGTYKFGRYHSRFNAILVIPAPLQNRKKTQPVPWFSILEGRGEPKKKPEWRGYLQNMYVLSWTSPLKIWLILA